MDLETQHERLSQLELETTKMRHTTFTALVATSFLLPGLALNNGSKLDKVHLFGHELTLTQLVFFLGFLFYCFALFHYQWYHRYSHRYRRALKDLEEKLNIEIYRLRQRPCIGPFNLHFDWGLYVIGVIYGGLTATYVGTGRFAIGVGTVCALYALLMVVNVRRPVEPLER